MPVRMQQENKYKGKIITYTKKKKKENDRQTYNLSNMNLRRANRFVVSDYRHAVIRFLLQILLIYYIVK
jgi:hypothetical protein